MHVCVHESKQITLTGKLYFSEMTQKQKPDRSYGRIKNSKKILKRSKKITEIIHFVNNNKAIDLMQLSNLSGTSRMSGFWKQAFWRSTVKRGLGEC